MRAHPSCDKFERRWSNALWGSIAALIFLIWLTPDAHASGVSQPSNYNSSNVTITGGTAQNIAVNYVTTVGGTADAITLSGTVTSYASAVGQVYVFKASGNNTVSPPTISINGLAALNTTMGSVAVPIGGLISGNFYEALIESPTSIRLAPFDSVSSNGDTVNGNLTIGNGTTGLVLMPLTSGGNGAIYSTSVTPGNNNYSFATNANTTTLNAASSVNLAVNNTLIAGIYSTGVNITGTLNGVLLNPFGMPTISSGFGVGSAVLAGGSNYAFVVNTGTSITATGVLSMPSATTGWRCICSNQAYATGTCSEIATTTSTITLENRIVTTNIQGFWPASTNIFVMCWGY